MVWEATERPILDKIVRRYAEKWSNVADGNGYTVSLNGEPAVIIGRLNPFATVRQINGTLSAEFSWPTVNLIMTDGFGEFDC